MTCDGEPSRLFPSMSSSSRRLLIVVNDAPFFLSHRLPLALGAKAAGYEVHVATPADDAVKRVEAAGLEWHELPLSRRGTSPAEELTTIQALIALYRRLRPTVAHHVTAKPILYGGIAARVTHTPCAVFAVTGLGYAFISNSARARAIRTGIRAVYRYVTRHPNCAVIFQNDDDRAVIGGAVRTPNITMIRGSGVDLEQFPVRPLPIDTSIVVVPSRLLRDKGIIEFVESARALKREGVSARFVLVGGIDPNNPAGIPQSEVEAWVREGVVEWWGLRSDMPDVLAQATIVCLPSYREGMPKALLEAIAVGRPIVTTDVPGCRDVFFDNRDYGILVAVRDVKALTDALRHLLTDRPRLERMAEAARTATPHVDVRHVVAKTLEVYASLERTL